MADLEITVGADQGAIKLLENQIQRLQRLLALPDLSFKQYERLNDMLRKSQSQLQQFSRNVPQTFNKLQQSSNTATFALTNLGRVAQDLPFGFIGIANNLNPLLESFQRLRAETGSTKAALGALTTSLTGAGGIGIALSAITAAISISQLGFSAWTRGFGDTNDKLEEHKVVLQSTTTAYEKFLEEVDKVSVAMSEQAAQTTILGKAFADFSDDIALTTQLRGLLPEFEGMIQKVIKLKIELNEMKRFQGGFFGLPEEEFQTQSKAIQEQIRVTTRDIEFAKKVIKKSAGDLNLAEALFGVKQKDKKDIETIADVLADMEAQLVVLEKHGRLFNVNESLNEIKEIEGTIDELFKKFPKLGDENPLILNLKWRAEGIAEREELRKMMPALQDTITANPLTATINIKLPEIQPPEVDPFEEAREKLQKKMEDFQKNFKESTQTLIIDSISSVGEAIGNAFSGGKDTFKGLFDGIFNSVGDQLKALGKFLIKSAIEIKLAKEAFKKLLANPLASIAVGLGLIALGSLIKAQVGRAVPGFAGGGFVDGPGSSKSDSIPARLSKGEFVINAETVRRFGIPFFKMINGGQSRPPNFANGGLVSGSIGGGQNLVVEVVGRLRGKDIYFSNINTGRTIGRNT